MLNYNRVPVGFSPYRVEHQAWGWGLGSGWVSFYSWVQFGHHRGFQKRGDHGQQWRAEWNPPPPPNPPPHSHHHHRHIIITIITYSIVHPCVGHCARCFTYIAAFSSHNCTPLHLGTWGLEKPHDLSKDTAGQMVELEIEQVCLNTKPLPSTIMPYGVSLVLD